MEEAQAQKDAPAEWHGGGAGRAAGKKLLMRCSQRAAVSRLIADSCADQSERRLGMHTLSDGAFDSRQEACRSDALCMDLEGGFVAITQAQKLNRRHAVLATVGRNIGISLDCTAKEEIMVAFLQSQVL